LRHAPQCGRPHCVHAAGTARTWPRCSAWCCSCLRMMTWVREWQQHGVRWEPFTDCAASACSACFLVMAPSCCSPPLLSSFRSGAARVVPLWLLQRQPAAGHGGDGAVPAGLDRAAAAAGGGTHQGRLEEWALAMLQTWNGSKEGLAVAAALHDAPPPGQLSCIAAAVVCALHCSL